MTDLLGELPKDSFLVRWCKAWPLAESPKSFILFSAMGMLGAALGRRVWLDQDAHQLFPMLNLLLIGPSGIGKSTSITKIGFPLLRSLPDALQPGIIAGKATPESLHEELVARPHTVVFASELANFFSRAKYMEDMIPYVTQLLDYEPRVERRTRGTGLLVVQDPSVSVIGGSTVEWLQGQLPDSAASGGFLARFLIVKEDHKGQRVANPKSMLSKREWEALYAERDECNRVFSRIVGQLNGPITWRDFAANDAYGVWYQNYMPATGALSPFSARAGEFVLRLAIIVAVSCERDYLMDIDIEAAIKLYEYSAAKLQEVVVPYSINGKLLSKILAELRGGPKTPVEIRRALKNIAMAQEVDRGIQSLIMSKDISPGADGKIVRNL